MKKSCSVKESKVVANKDVDEKSLNECREEDLTEEQAYINKKLSESGIESEGLSWLEKRNIFRTINVSLNSSRTDRNQRSSPRFAKSNSTRAGKWLENSFENPGKEDAHRDLDDEKALKGRSVKSDAGTNSYSHGKSLPLKTSEDFAETGLKPNNLKRNGEINGSSSKTSKKVHYIKVQVEGSWKEGCGAGSEGSSKEDGQAFLSGKKRTSSPETGDGDAAKKFKMEREESNKVPSKEQVPLRIEMEMERRRLGVEFKMRDIKAIVFENEWRNKKWKETFSKYKCPARWGIPIVRSCSEKWDGKRIPPKLLHRYQKYLSSNNLFHPVFLPAKSQSSVASDSNKTNSEISSQSSIGTNSECRDELENDFRDASQGFFVEEEAKKFASENNLSPSSSESNGRMVLRNRNQQKPVILDEDGYSSDDSDEWLTKQKPGKKQKTNTKNKKNANQNKQLVLKLERCNINKKNGSEETRKNGDESFPANQSLGNNPLNQSDAPLKLGFDPDTMVCPICSLRFKKQHIESHATECASKTYKD